MSLSIGSIAAALIIAAVGFSGCGSRSDPAKPFADAEVLRARHEKDASQLAIARYREAQAAWTQSGDRRNAARAAQGVGATYEQLGSLRESLRAYSEALTLAQSSADRRLESEIRSDVGTAQSLTADRDAMFDEAQSQCQTALALARQHGSDGGAAKALGCLGDAAYYRQRPEQAMQFYREAGALWDKLGDQKGEALTLLAQGQVFSDLSQFGEARDCYERSRELWDAIHDQRQLAIVEVSEARRLMRLGDYQQALNGFEQARARLQPMGDALWEGGSLDGIAQIHRDLGEVAPAIKYWERALRAFETAGIRNVTADALLSLGTAYLASGDDASALDRFQRALRLGSEQGIDRWTTFALRFIGVVHLFRRDPNLAEQYLQRSLTAQHAPAAAADSRLEGQTRADLGEASELRGHHDAALAYFSGALGLSRAAGDRVTEARALYGLARTSVGRDDLDAARRYVEGALQVAESLRTDVVNRDLRTSFSASVHQWHELHLDVLMQLARRRSNPALATAAFEASERARARSLLESLTDAAVDVRAGVDADLMKQEQVLDRAFTDWAARNRQAVASGSNRGATAMAEEYRDLEYRSSQLQALIRSRNPAYAALTRPQSVSLQDVQRQLLDEHTMLLEYSLGEERSYLWAVSKTDRRSYELPPRAEIERSAQRVYERLTARLTATGDEAERNRQIARADAEYWPEAARLSAMLLQPIAATMARKRLLLVTDGTLQSLPFGALPVPGAHDMVPMVVEHEIVNLPSASVLAVLRRDTGRRTPPPKTVAVLADPVFERDDPRLPLATGAVVPPGPPASSGADARGAASPSGQPTRSLRITRDGVSSIPRLTSTRQEAADIVAAAGGGTSFKALDFDASRATAMGPELANYRIVHFAAHGVLNNDEPGLSGIILSMFDRGGQPEDGFLRLRDIYGLRLPVDLVVLSACSTALGKPVRGEGIVGMVRGFMYAGAKRVVASYWRVDDEATGDLMRLFYGEMLARHRSPAAALRQAQLAMLRQDRWTPPFYWAAFVLQGEWK